MKMSLEELKARSKVCGSWPELINIAREAKSPTAAFDMASAGEYVQTIAYAKQCRYLAMVKRDYGKKIFEKTVEEISRESRVSAANFYIQPFIQTATHLLNIYFKMTELGNERIVLSSYDVDYADMVEEMLEVIENTDAETREKIYKEVGAKQYFREARCFVRDVRNGTWIDGYCLKKTAKVLYVSARIIGKKDGIPSIALELGVGVWHYVSSRKHTKKSDEVVET